MPSRFAAAFSRPVGLQDFERQRGLSQGQAEIFAKIFGLAGRWFVPDR
jgi:hypothetical protein